VANLIVDADRLAQMSGPAHPAAAKAIEKNERLDATLLELGAHRTVFFVLKIISYQPLSFFEGDPIKGVGVSGRGTRLDRTLNTSKILYPGDM
jgi:hypothetical protein